MQSIVSYPDRGNWGDSSWRGNTTGHIIVDLCKQFNPQYVLDICCGSGTTGDVCKELGIEYTGLDLHQGQDFTKQFALDFMPRPADLSFSHLPYADMIRYSGNVWGSRPVEGDISQCSIDEFIVKAQLALMNQREATRSGGHYTSLIGDLRRKGSYYSFQSDLIQAMPKDELAGVVIKQQHNMVSSRKNYTGNFIPIVHEYLLIWKKKDKSLYHVFWDKAKELKKQVASTWRNAVRLALMALGGQGSLKEIYSEVEKIAQPLIENNQHYRAKIRQVLQYHFQNVERGVWAA